MYYDAKILHMLALASVFCRCRPNNIYGVRSYERRFTVKEVTETWIANLLSILVIVVSKKNMIIKDKS